MITVKNNRAVIQLVALALITLGVASHPAEAVFDPTLAVETTYVSDIHFGQGDGEDVSTWEDSLMLALPLRKVGGTAIRPGPTAARLRLGLLA